MLTVRTRRDFQCFKPQISPLLNTCGANPRERWTGAEHMRSQLQGRFHWRTGAHRTQTCLYFPASCSNVTRIISAWIAKRMLFFHSTFFSESQLSPFHNFVWCAWKNYDYVRTCLKLCPLHWYVWHLDCQPASVLLRSRSSTYVCSLFEDGWQPHQLSSASAAPLGWQPFLFFSLRRLRHAHLRSVTPASKCRSLAGGNHLPVLCHAM